MRLVFTLFLTLYYFTYLSMTKYTTTKKKQSRQSHAYNDFDELNVKDNSYTRSLTSWLGYYKRQMRVSMESFYEYLDGFKFLMENLYSIAYDTDKDLRIKEKKKYKKELVFSSSKKGNYEIIDKDEHKHEQFMLNRERKYDYYRNRLLKSDDEAKKK